MSARELAGFLVGALFLSMLGGCAGVPHDDARLDLNEQLGRAREQAAWERARAAEARAAMLESRVARLESGAREAAIAQRLESSRVLERLDRVLEVTESLVEVRAREAEATLAPSPSTKASSNDEAAPKHETVGGDVRDAQVRALARMLLSSGGSSQGLSADEERALRLLLRAERKLDTRNPWPNALY
jgi:hypothetical protein